MQYELQNDSSAHVHSSIQQQAYATASQHRPPLSASLPRPIAEEGVADATGMVLTRRQYAGQQTGAGDAAGSADAADPKESAPGVPGTSSGLTSPTVTVPPPVHTASQRAKRRKTTHSDSARGAATGSGDDNPGELAKVVADPPAQNSGRNGSAETQQSAADRVYHSYLQELTLEQLDFVRKGGQWPAIRTSRNKLGAADNKPCKKKDWHAQRSAFITEVFKTMQADADCDEQTVLDNMFDGGNYGWLLDTTAVICAVQKRYTSTRSKAFTALAQLCEVKCGDYLSESCFSEEYRVAKLAYVDAAKNPDTEAAPSRDSTHAMYAITVLVFVFATVMPQWRALAPMAGFAVGGCIMTVARIMETKRAQAHAALEREDYDTAAQ
eukprot:COSAG01_NODE_4216_length_5230_cov_54.626778_1_plen_381_part_10